jgi:thiamine pyrophosphokinase
MRIVVFANGIIEDVTRESELWVESDSLLISADGGTRHAHAAGLVPDHVIGDMDSLPVELQLALAEQDVQFHRSPVAKDETDLELALLWAAKQPEMEEIVVLGAFGGRPDQALANMLLLALPALMGFRVLLVDGEWTVRLIRGRERLTIHGDVGDRLSLIPLAGPAEGVTTQGLEFVLKGETLAVGPARGVSNRLASNVATIELGAGMVWCFHERGARAS